jgi:phage protein D
MRIHAPMKMEQTQCSKTLTIKHHMPENNPKGYTRKTNQFMMYTAHVPICSEICTKHSMQSEHHVEVLDVKPGGM